MGYTFVVAEVSDLRRRLVKRVRFLVDTGAGFMVIPPRLAAELGIEPLTKMEVTLADGRKKLVDLGFAYIRILDREAVVHAIIMETPEPIVGTFTMQILGLTVDPVSEEVKPTRSFAIGLL